MGLRKIGSNVLKEGKRVRWPKRDVFVPAMIVVIIIAVLAALILFGEDLAGKKLLEILKQTIGK